METKKADSSKNIFRADHEMFRMIGTEKEVTVFARQRYPFEPKEPWQREYRRMLQAALSFLSAGKDEILWAAYGTEKEDFYDLENVLFYNIGTGWFRRSSVNGFCFTDHSAEEIAKAQRDYGIPKDFTHLYTYRLQQAGPISPQIEEPLLASWEAVPIFPVTTSITPLGYWRWVKENLSSFRIVEGEHQGPFSVCLVLDTPKAGVLNTTSVVKCLLDGIICAFHGAADTMDLSDWCRRLDCPADWLENTQAAPLGKREYIRPYRGSSLAWNPADDKCRECIFQVRYSSQWRLGGFLAVSSRRDC